MLNLPATAEKLELLLIKHSDSIALPPKHPEFGVNHLKWMCRQVYNEQVTGNLAHQWLGFVQGALVTSGASNVSEMLEISEIEDSAD